MRFLRNLTNSARKKSWAGFSSCSDSFLDEENKSSYTTDYFKTSQGIQDLATALYGNIRWHFGYEWAYGITLYGTDDVFVFPVPGGPCM